MYQPGSRTFSNYQPGMHSCQAGPMVTLRFSSLSVCLSSAYVPYVVTMVTVYCVRARSGNESVA